MCMRFILLLLKMLSLGKQPNKRWVQKNITELNFMKKKGSTKKNNKKNPNKHLYPGIYSKH